MIHNRVGSIVRGDDFYGRDDFVRQVSERLQEGSSVLLAAPRRFGKTSIMHRLMHQPLWDYQIVHVDLEGLSHPADFLTKLIENTAKLTLYAEIISKMNRAAKELVSKVRGSVDEIEAFDARIKLREAITPNWRELARSFMNSIAAVGHPIVFFLDELPMLLDHLCKTPEGKADAIALLRWLRELRQNPQMHNLRFVLAGSIGIERILNQIGEIATINDFERMKLQPFPIRVAEQFLDALAASYRLPLSLEARTAILTCIGPPVPYFLQILFGETRKYYDDEKIAPDAPAILRLYRDRVLGEDCKSYFDHYHGRFNRYYEPYLAKAAKVILRELARVGSMKRDACQHFYQATVTQQSQRADPDEFAGLMADLEYEFYVAYDTEQRCYRFACKLLRDWWLRHYGL
jgi:uncharacterized protein